MERNYVIGSRPESDFLNRLSCASIALLKHYAEPRFAIEVRDMGDFLCSGPHVNETPTTASYFVISIDGDECETRVLFRA